VVKGKPKKQATMKLFTKSLLIPALGFCVMSMQGQGSMTGTIVNQPCNNNGNIGVTAIGLTPPISYTYSNWIINQTFVHANINSVNDNLTGIPAYSHPWANANVWWVSASDGSNNAFFSFTLTPAFSMSIVDSAGVCPSPSTLHAYFTGGTPPFAVQWTNMSTNTNYNNNPAYVSNGIYSVVATDAAGCKLATSTFSGGIFVQSSSNINVSISGSPANCTNGTATVTATGGTTPYTYLWNNNATSQSLSGLTMGSYNCIVTDNIGCQKTAYYYVSQAVTINHNKTITNATCLQNNGAVTSFVSGGTPPYTFLWTNAATTQNLTGIGAGNYNVQITDANGCIGFGWANVAATTPISVTYTTGASSCTLATGSATLASTGGASPYSVIWYTFPSNSTGNVISGKPPGNYSFKVTDANGCIQTGAATIPPISTLSGFINNNYVTCPATIGSLSVSVSGSHPPFTYAWSNAATTSAITGVGLGYYSCTITDAAGCSIVKSGGVIQQSPVNVGLVSNPVTCLYSTNGSLIANALGGTPPYSYQWSNSVSTPANTGLGIGYYYVTATDANGCKKTVQGHVGNSGTSNNCYCTITGTVFADANSNCVKGFGETGIPNIQIHCSGFGYAYTDANGIYSFKVPTGTYTLSESVQQIYPLAPCQNNNLVVAVTASANCVTTVNFANNVIPISDLRIITTNWNWPVPGNTYSQRVIVQNDGSVIENTIKLGYAHDGQLSFNNCTPWSLTQPNSSGFPNWYRINSGFPGLNPAALSTALVTYNVPTNIPINTLVNFKDSVAKNNPISTNWLTDNTPWNNVNDHYATVVSSFDPNFKEVSPAGTGPQGDITSKDSILTYVVHFQNEGTYFAQNVVVVDTLDSDLRVNTVKPGYATHRYVATVSETGVLKFSFDNIYLPWKSAYGDALSSGMFVYSVKLKKNLAVGTQIKNKAAIYFDYNEPIITNTTLNTIAKPTTTVSVAERMRGGAEAILFPNPANSYFTLMVNSEEASGGTLSVYDISGRLVSAKAVTLQPGENSFLTGTENLQSGIYIVRLDAEDLSVSGKVVITK
jgi:hypothetical protein